MNQTRFRSTTLSGLAVGLVAAVAALLAHVVVVTVTGVSFAQLSLPSITAATLVAVVAGAWVYRLMAARLQRPARAFAVLAAVAAVADTVLATLAGQGPGFVLEAAVLHVVVAVVAALGVPYAAARS